MADKWTGMRIRVGNAQYQIQERMGSVAQFRSPGDDPKHLRLDWKIDEELYIPLVELRERPPIRLHEIRQHRYYIVERAMARAAARDELNRQQDIEVFRVMQNAQNEERE